MARGLAAQQRFASTLVLAEYDGDNISAATRSAVTAAASLGDVTMLVCGADAAGAVDAAGKVAGVSKV